MGYTHCILILYIYIYIYICVCVCVYLFVDMGLLVYVFFHLCSYVYTGVCIRENPEKTRYDLFKYLKPTRVKSPQCSLCCDLLGCCSSKLQA